MIDISPAANVVPVRPDGLRLETKTGWAVGQVAIAQRFVHCSTSDLRHTGIDPMRSNEWVVDGNEVAILGGRLVFAFPVAEPDGQPTVPPPVAFFGMARFMHVFTAHPGTWFACHAGSYGGGAVNLQIRKEVAFPYQIEVADIEVFDIPQPVIPTNTNCCGRSACCIIM